MSVLEEQYRYRDGMVGAIESDLLGPGSPDEELDEAPLDRYVTGILYPAGVADVEEEPDDPESADAGGRPDGGYDPGVALARMRHPSSMGLSFAVDLAVTKTVSVTIDAGRYQQLTESADRPTSSAHSRARRPRGGQRWQRTPIESYVVELSADRADAAPTPVALGLELYCVVREAHDGIAPLTVVLRNRLSVPRDEARDGYCWFQPRLIVTGPDGSFVDRRRGRTVGVDDEDLESYDLLFRDVRSFAVGHGCAVTWAPRTSNTVSRLETTFLPVHDVRLAVPVPRVGVDLRMSFLATADDATLQTNLRTLVDEYRSWIAEKRREGESLPAQLSRTADRHMDEATRAADRIVSGIELLGEMPAAMTAFRLMNRAMQAQRARQDWIRDGAQGTPPEGKDQAWHPFQIAFILLSLRGIADPSHGDRETADLLWFPTGGGKTEAYLGLIGFSVLLRRLTSPQAGGVSVLMRYTLRLLTIQQFERAASLICALETLRRTEPDLTGTSPISLGLWVGMGATPNDLDEARRNLKKIGRNEPVNEGNPVQLTRCPWCGVPLDHDNYAVDKAVPELRIACGNPSCRFERGLPVHLVDDDVYRVRPSLLIGTVDKFAMLAWRPEAGSIFSTDGQGLPPDLIVQDELHLISGPLGTLVGLYEAAIDAACATEHRPKVVASTATIRRARTQMRAVFDRRAAQFPPQGLTVGDTFFSEDATPDQKGTRRFVGVMAPGTSQTTLMVRSYAALLQAAQDRPAADEVKDPYWTLVGYFNSLRVLGGAFMQVVDDVPDRLKVIASRAGTEPRPVSQPLELTSRTDSPDIPLYLERLAEKLPSANSPDVVLATNMISVGVDIDRLGLMAVMGQPQATAEYIQATSRVGRKFPGLVVVLYNSARSRDRSHYEDFLPYHQALYRQVEATSATPFAARARDRGLHGVLVAMARLLAPGAAPDTAAGQVASFRSALEQFTEQIVERARRADPDAADDTEAQLDELIDIWEREADARGSLRYAAWNDPMNSLLVNAGDALTDPDLSLDTENLPWPTLTSLRDVDATSHLHVIPNRERSKS